MALPVRLPTFIKPFAVFGLVSKVVGLYSYLDFSKTVGFIVTPAPALVSLNVDLAGTDFFILSTSD